MVTRAQTASAGSTTQGSTGHDSTTRPARHGHPGWVLAVCCIAQFMVVLDVSIVNVALPSIGSELRFDPTGLQWVVNAYTITFAGILLLGGRAADLFGRRRMLLIGLAVFGAASLLGGLAQAPWQLTAARAAQGLGGALLAPATLTVLTVTFTEPAARARALGAWSAVAGAGGAVGVLAGGVLTDALDWRWVLFVNVPIALGALVVAAGAVPESHGQSARHLDIGGALLGTLGLLVLVYGVVETERYGWASVHTLVLLLAAVALLAVFVLVEARLARNPLVRLSLFRSRGLTGANLLALMLGAAMFGSFYFISLYGQDVLGWSPLKTGAAFLPFSAALITATTIAAKTIARVGPRALLTLGAGTAAVGMLWASRLPAHGTFVADLLGPMILIALGVGTCFVPMTVAATVGVPREDAGLASGVLNTSRQLGGAVGLAVLVTLSTSQTVHLIAGGTAKREALASGYGRALVLAGVLLVVGAIAAQLIPRVGAPAPGAGVGVGVASTGQLDDETPAGEARLDEPERAPAPA